MPGTAKQELKLSATASRVFLPVITAFTEKSALAFGLGSEEALALTLAVEEVTAYLSRVGAPGKPVQVFSRGGGYYAEIELVFEPREFDMRAFNLTASASFDNDTGLNETGLLIASRMVDRFSFSQDQAALSVTLRKDKVYPEPAEANLPQLKQIKEYAIREPEPEELKECTRIVTRLYDSHLCPSTFTTPGKAVDMAAAGDYNAVIAVSSAGDLGGAIVWQYRNERIVEFFGPYIFNDRSTPTMADDLVDACISGVAKSGAQGLLSCLPTKQLPVVFFEPLGSLTIVTDNGNLVELPAYYRHLDEDPGATVWAHRDLVDYLKKEYVRMALPRDVHEVVSEGEKHSPFSVIEAEFDKTQGSVMLMPIWWGDDAAETLRAYVEILVAEAIPGIFFILDLGKSWHGLFYPALEQAGFQPGLILPYGGKSDLVVCQYPAGERPA